uniref:SFRICE_012671 n=1 Tax=Spodoptera frugiperda TaxID=7108 RepID=A0A2H1VE78_SPOFR
MGRTRRKRNIKKERDFCACDNPEEIILLNSWLSKHGMRRNDKLSLAVFHDTGRGVLTKKKIQSGEELMNLPLNLTINVTTILMDNLFYGGNTRTKTSATNNVNNNSFYANKLSNKTHRRGICKARARSALRDLDNTGVRFLRYRAAATVVVRKYPDK